MTRQLGKSLKPSLLLLPARAVYDYYMLLMRGYTSSQAMSLVKQRYSFTSVQEKILKRCIHPKDIIVRVRRGYSTPGMVRDRLLCIDGYNQALTLVSASAYGYVYRCVDGYLRDEIGGPQTVGIDKLVAAARRLVAAASMLKPLKILVVFDAQVPYSGELASKLRRLGVKAIAVKHADKTLISCGLKGAIVASSDIVVLTNTSRHIDLAAYTIRRLGIKTRIIDVKDLLTREHESWCKTYNP